MTLDLALFRCPACGGRLDGEAPAGPAAGGGRGRLACAGCAREYPVRDGVPRFVDGDVADAESFGIQWTRYEVQRPAEDQAVFHAKTGFGPAELAGRLVLDAGCGSGRYAVVAAGLGARVVAVDATRAVERARALADAAAAPVLVAQADLFRLPFGPASFDAIYSLGVLHHTRDTRAALAALLPLLRPGGRLAVWVYRRNTRLQEGINRGLRALTTRLSDRALHGLARAGAAVGGTPGLRHLNLLVPFSSHPDARVRVCDTYDWYAPRFQHHHTEAEVVAWFRAGGLTDVRVRPGYVARGAWYDWWQARGLMPGSGFSVVGRAPASAS
jgi:SAM-dependent methyltransferase